MSHDFLEFKPLVLETNETPIVACSESFFINIQTRIEKGEMKPVYDDLKLILEKYPDFRHIYAIDLFAFTANCCKDYNETNRYSENEYCCWRLLLSYGLSPKRIDEFEFCDILNTPMHVNERHWAHLSLMFQSNIQFSPMEYYFRLLAEAKLDLIETLFRFKGNCLGKNQESIEYDKYDDFYDLDKFQQMRVIDMIHKYKPKWLKFKAL